MWNVEFYMLPGGTCPTKEFLIPVKHKQYRLLYFYFYQEKIIISHGLRKEAKVKTTDIEKAKKHKADYFARHERNL
jgi:phage-related protein